MEKRDDGWWWTCPYSGEYGPYDTKQQAQEDERGIAKFFKENPEYKYGRVQEKSGLERPDNQGSE